ncbi:MAG: beta-propeller fold lactonase family protein [Bryobacterales bacterium]|nr:beta-propeller fold lactonase family protein [Bryobacterales bacterium]
MRFFWIGLTMVVALAAAAQQPGKLQDGYALPNGWRITPTGSSVVTEDLVLNEKVAPDGRVIVATHGGFNQHGLVVMDVQSREAVQRIPLKSAFLGLAWAPKGNRLFVSGGNATSRRDPSRAVIYEFGYTNGRLSEKPLRSFEGDEEPDNTFWAGLRHHPSKPLLYAAHRGTNAKPGHVAVFSVSDGKLLAKIGVEVTPYDVEISPDGNTLYVSNWSSDSVSVIDTNTNTVKAVIAVDDNPNDLVLSPDGRLFVACANSNTVVVIDTAKYTVFERIRTSMFANAPEGSTPNALALTPDGKTLFVANADNNNLAVVDVENRKNSEVEGFIPVGWYPSSLELSKDGKLLFVGNSKGVGSYSNERGPHSPLSGDGPGKGSVKSLQKGSIEMLEVAAVTKNLAALTEKAYANCPYNDEMLTTPRMPANPPSVIPSRVGQTSPIKHVIYIIKENRTYDQVLGDIPKGNGDPRITIFGKQVTPNHHKIAEDYVLFDNLYCDGEVSVDGHAWSNAAYATDFNEKWWPSNYGGHTRSLPAMAFQPASGYLWDQALRKGLTYRSYGEFTIRPSEANGVVEAAPGFGSLVGHVAPKFKLAGNRDTDNAIAFIEEFDEYERNYDDADANKRLPNYIVMSLGEDHTQGTRPGVPTPRAAVASNDLALGMIVERVSQSKYWKETAIFVIQDDAQDGSDHVDARRTVALVISPWVKRGAVDSTHYTTSSMLRTMELILGLNPMSQFDAAAMPMYNAFTDTPDFSPYRRLQAAWNINEMNKADAPGAAASLEMDFTEYDLIPMRALNEVIWKSVHGADAEMPPPVRSYQFGRVASEDEEAEERER